MVQSPRVKENMLVQATVIGCGVPFGRKTGAWSDLCHFFCFFFEELYLQPRPFNDGRIGGRTSIGGANSSSLLERGEARGSRARSENAALCVASLFGGLNGGPSLGLGRPTFALLTRATTGPRVSDPGSSREFWHTTIVDEGVF